MSMTISDILSRNVKTVSPDTALAEAAVLMSGKRISCLVAVEQGKPVGILTEADLVRAIRLETDAEATTISDFLSQPVITASSEQSIYDAFEFLLEHRVRHLVVTRSDGSLEGLLTFTDILRAADMDDFLTAKQIGHEMSRNVVRAEPQATIAEVVDQMVGLHISCVVVVEEGRAEGMFTERDAARLLAAGSDISAIRVGEVMTTPLLTRHESDSLLAAANLMREHKIRRVAIVDDAGAPVGILTQFDVIRGLEGRTIRHYRALHSQLEERLDESRQLLAEKSEMERIVDTSPAVLYRCGWDEKSEQFIATYVSSSMTSMLGYDRHECLMPGWWIEHLHPDERRKAEAAMKKLLKTGEMEHVYRFADSNGEYRWIRDHVRLNRSTEGEPKEIVGSWLDITEARETEQARHESEELYRALVEQSFDGTVMLAADGTVTFVNQAAADAWGGKPEQLLGRCFRDIVHPDDREQMENNFRLRMQGAGPEKSYEIRMLRKNGDVAWVEISGKLISWRGEPADLLTVRHITVRHITERKLAEQELKASEQKLLQAQYVAQLGDFSWDIESGHVTWSKGIHKLLKYGLDEQIDYNRVNTEIHHPDDLDRVTAWLQEAVASGKPELPVNEYRLVCKDGEVIWVETNGRFEFEAGKAVRLFGTCHNITERKRAEQAWRDETKRNELILQSSMDGFILADDKGQLVDVNPAYCDMVGYSRDELLGMNIVELEAKLTPEQVGEKIGRMMQDGSARFESQHRHKHGHVIDLDVSIFVMQQDGKAPLVSAFVRDISERKKAAERIEKSEQKFRSLFDEARNLIHITDANGIITDVNRAELNRLGYEYDEMVGRSVLEFVADDYRDSCVEAVGKVCSGSSFAGYETQFKTSAGESVWVEISATPQIDQQGNVIAARAIMQDITERKLAEKSAAEATALQQSVISTAPVRIFWKDKDLRYLGCNQLFVEDAGLNSADEIIGKDDSELGWKSQKDLYQQDDLAVIESGKPKLHFEEPQTTPDGQTIWLRTSKVPLRNGSGKIIGVLGAYEDITERKQSAAKLAASEQKFRSLFEESRDMMHIVGTDGLISDVNRVELETLGYSRQEMIGKPVSEIICPEHRNATLKRIHRIISGKKVELAETALHAKDGTCIAVEVSATPQLDENGRVMAGRAIIRDIRTRKLEEALLARRERQLAVLAEAARLINEQLDEIEIGRRLVELAGRLVDCESGAVGFYRNEKICFREYAKQGERMEIELDFPSGYGVPGHVLATREPYLSSDAPNDAHVIPEIQQSLGFIKLIDVPILDAEDELLGCFEMHDRNDGADFDGQDLEMLQSLAGIVAAALVNARQQAEIEQAAARMRTVLDADFDAVVVHQGFKVVFSNREAQTMFGYDSLEDTLGEDALQAFVPEQRKLAERAARNVLRSGRPTARLEMMGVSRNRAEPFPIEIASARIEWKGRPALVSIVRDITEQKQAEEKLKEAHRLHNLAQRIAHLGHWDLDHAAGTLHWSDEVYRIFGLERENFAVSYEAFQQIVHPDDRETLTRAYELSLKNRASYELEHRIVRPDGEIKWVFEQCETSFDEDGNPIRSLGTVQDITEHKLAEQAVEKERVALHAILNNLPFMGWLKDDESRFITVNERFAAACDAESAEALVGKTDLDIWPEELAIAYRLDDRDVMESGKSKQVQEEMAVGGEKRWFETFKSPVFNADGKVVGTAGMALDITDRLHNQEQLRLLESAVASVNESIIVTDVNGTIVYVNPSFTANTGFAPEDAIGNTPAILNSKQQQKGFYEQFWGTIMAGKPWSGRILDRKKDGTIFPVHLSVAPIFSPEGEITHFVAVHEDLTQAEAMQQKMMQSQKMEAVGTMVGGIAHDFNNMLASIVGNFYLIRMQHADDEKLVNRVRRMEESTQHGAKMIQQMLTFSRQDRTDMHALNLKSFIKEAYKLAAAGVPENIRFRLETGADCDSSIMADATQLQQVFLNLVTNARHAIKSQDEGHITLRLDTTPPPETVLASNPEFVSDSGWVRIACEDSGCGIRPEHLERVFEPFFTTKPVGEGTGLGLAMVYGAVQNHRGLIDIDSEPEKGTTVSIWLPRHEAKEADVVGVDEAEIDGAGHTVLIVDDETELRRVLAEVLLQCGFSVLQASDGVQAVEIFEREQERIDIVLMDVVMPNKGGVMSAKEIREISADVPIIFQTGYGEQTQLDAAESIPSSTALQKPVQIPVLMRMISENLGSRPVD